MSLLDILKPPAPPKRNGKVVRGLKRDLKAEQRKAETLAQYEERLRQERATAKAARMKQLNADPAFREKVSARMKQLHADPAFREKERVRKSARMKQLHADPAFREKERVRKSARMKQLNADPAFREKVSARMKQLHADPAFREKVSKSIAANRARKLEDKIDRLKAELLAARKAAAGDES